MLEPVYNLPAGVNVDTDRDAVNSTDAPIVVQLAPVMRSFGVVVGEEEGTVRLEPGERFVFYRGVNDRHFDCTVTCGTCVPHSGQRSGVARMS